MPFRLMYGMLSLYSYLCAYTGYTYVAECYYKCFDAVRMTCGRINFNEYIATSYYIKFCFQLFTCG